MKRSRTAAISAVAILAGMAYAYAAGLFSTLPIVGGATFCSTATGAVTSTACVSSVPAGPAGLTGTEVVPADTGFAGGRQPQSVTIPVGTLGAALAAFPSLLPSQASPSFTISANVASVIISATAALSPTTITFPANAVDGQRLRLSSQRTIASLTLNGAAGQTIDAATKPTALTASTTAAYGYEWVFRGTDSTWYRLQ